MGKNKPTPNKVQKLNRRFCVPSYFILLHLPQKRDETEKRKMEKIKVPFKNLYSNIPIYQH